MCKPTHFGVRYVINPWMRGQVGRADSARAMQQWHQLHDLLCTLADVEVIDPGADGRDLPDMVFCANAGLVLGDTFVPSAFRVPERAGEVPLFNRWFADQGFTLAPLGDDTPFEGEGDALFHPGRPLLWAGYGVRSGIEAHPTLTERFSVEVVSLRLVDQRFYHLDTCFYPLPDGRVVYYAPAFDEPSRQEIARRIPAEDRIEVSESDALRFTCNAVRLGDTLVTNHAGDDLQARLNKWGYKVATCCVDEFMLAGGACKCMTLLLKQDLGRDADNRPTFTSPVQTGRVSLRGHLLDQGTLNKAMDIATDAGLGCSVEQFHPAERRDQSSTATLRVTAPTGDRLDTTLAELMTMGATPLDEEQDASLCSVELPGVAPDGFYSTTIYPTDVRVNGSWARVNAQRMDAVIVVGPQDGQAEPAARCVLMRDLMPGDRVVCHVGGVRVKTPRIERDDEFGFMSSSVSSERRVEQAVESLAWEMDRIKARGGRIAVVAGPVVIHTGGGRHLEQLIRHGYVQALLTGNALPVHDIEHHLFGTSLGVDLSRGVGVQGGHRHHLQAINKVRRAGSIKQAVNQGVVTGGVMHACVQNGVDYVLAGSIRDDGPLPDTKMDLFDAQQSYAKAIEGCDMILMLSSMLHAIGTGNMTPAGVKLVCVDISPAVVTKLADRGSVESVGIVTDVGLLLNLLAARLCEGNEA
jgi:lysine-ketoglutarate reductase/saccharopine dehydrogenase-like protein (TIGR00300 family)